MTLNPNSLHIDLSAVAHNLRQARNRIEGSTKIMGIVKSDAYGHGLLPVAQTLAAHDVDALGVSYLQEALELRDAGIGLPLVILCGVQSPEEAQAVAENDLTSIVYDLHSAELLAREGARLGKRIPIHLKVDTGMGRLGISRDHIGAFLQRIIALQSLELEALTSHLSSADRPASEFTRSQIVAFHEALETARSLGVSPRMNNLANSAGVMGYPKSHFDMVRPGIMLYGGLPSPDYDSPVELRPAMHFKARVLQVRRFPDHTPLSYGRTYYTRGERKIAVISAGYADGLPRSISNRGRVLIGEQQVPVVGRVCMNLALCDVTGLERVRSEDEAVFLGSQGERTIRGDDIARWAGTISYEIFCGLGQRHPKRYRS